MTIGGMGFFCGKCENNFFCSLGMVLQKKKNETNLIDCPKVQLNLFLGGRGSFLTVFLSMSGANNSLPVYNGSIPLRIHLVKKGLLPPNCLQMLASEQRHKQASCV